MGDLQEWLSASLVWFALGLILLLLEFSSPGLILGFFAVGAWLVALISLIVEIPLNLQLGIFVGSSVVGLLLFRSKFKTLFNPDEQGGDDDTMQEFVGKQAVVSREIHPGKAGKVDFRGTYWGAEADEVIAVGSAVQIVDRENLTLKVRAL